MTNKLSELSKPVMYSITCNGVVEEIGGDSQGFVREEVQAELDGWENGSVGIPDGYSVSALYSQEYVSALKHESAVNWEAAASLNVENQELKKRIAELEQAMRHIHGAALDITVPRAAIAKAAELAVEYATMKE